MSNKRDPIVGDKVRLISTGEVGVVIWTWSEDDFTDTYVAFLGTEFPSERPKQLPYVLRYATTSLELISTESE